MADIKWDAFPSHAGLQSGDILVGLRSGVNVQFSSITGTFVQLAPTADQTITGAHNLIMATGSMIAPTMLPGNLSLSGNIISSINSNGNIDLIPNGTGMILGLGSTAFTSRPGIEIQKIGDEVNYTAGTFVNTAGGAPKFNVYKSRSTSIGSFVAVLAGDDLGIISGFGDDGTTFSQAAQIKYLAGSTISSGIVSGTLQLNTASTLGVMTNALTVDDGQIVSLTHPLPSASGGTGVNNGSNTLSLSGNLATSGAFASTFTMTGATNVTFPTSGTLLTSSSAVTSIAGTANQVIASASTGAVTLSLPQSIATSSNVQFAIITGNAINATAGNITALSGNAIVANSTTVSKGLIAMMSPDNIGNFVNIITNTPSNASRTWTFPDASGTVFLAGGAISASSISSAPAASQASSLTLGSAYQNTFGYDVVLTVYLAVTAATAGTIQIGVGSTNTPTQQTVVSGLTLAALAIIPLTIYIPNNYYALITLTTVTATISGQQAMPV